MGRVPVLALGLDDIDMRNEEKGLHSVSWLSATPAVLSRAAMRSAARVQLPDDSVVLVSTKLPIEVTERRLVRPDLCRRVRRHRDNECDQKQYRTRCHQQQMRDWSKASWLSHKAVDSSTLRR